MTDWKKVLSWAEEIEEEFSEDILLPSKVKPGMIGKDYNDNEGTFYCRWLPQDFRFSGIRKRKKRTHR
jgi:hypothetical protein